MEARYNAQDTEKWYQVWLDHDLFTPADSGEPYCIMMPPPNVTGTLHMGHALQVTISDILIRHHRMRGRRVLWQPGTDHAGIATQIVVDNQLRARGSSAAELGREAFIEKVWQWKKESGDSIHSQFKRLGASADWTRERFTMDEGMSRAVIACFVALYDKGWIYRGNRVINWDPVLRTAVSDLEVNSEETDGFLWHIQYPLVDDGGHITIATTRPETLLGDTALAVAPGDERFDRLVGHKAWVPMTDRQVEIIVDESVDPQFGSGCVKVTPAHDFNDYEIYRRHPELKIINIFTENACLNDEVPLHYRGLDRFEARKRIVSDLREAGLIERIEPHRYKLPRGDRSGAVLEPWLTDQWFVRVEKLAQAARESVASGQINILPERWKRMFDQWMENIHDWCISRQLWWGHRVPVWYAPDGRMAVGQDEADARHRAGIGEDVPLRQDDSVLDTWFSSALWPFSTLGWPEKTEELATYYPTSLMISGFDILFFWIARMVMFGLEFMDGAVPFKEVYIHGLVRDSKGQKMSKSKGNVLDPRDIIDGISLEELIARRTFMLLKPHQAEAIERDTRSEFPQGIESYGTDSLRLSFASQASQGMDLSFNTARVKSSRNFCNKLWNASRFVILNAEKIEAGEGPTEEDYVDRWIRSRLQRTNREISQHIEHYRFDLAVQALHQFTWDEFCDFYLEFAKPSLRGDFGEARARGVRANLLTVLETLLRLAHPFIPYVTEELWQRLVPLTSRSLNVGQCLISEPWPALVDQDVDREVEVEVGAMLELISVVRTLRSSCGIQPSAKVPLRYIGGDSERMERQAVYIRSLAKVSTIEQLSVDPSDHATAVIGQLKVFIPLPDKAALMAEDARLEKKIQRIEKDIDYHRGKLDNSAFVQGAPSAIVEKEKASLQRALDSLTGLQKKRSETLTP